MFVCCECRVLSGRGLCDELITHPEESYRLWCVIVCDIETSRMRTPWPALGRSATAKKKKKKLSLRRISVSQLKSLYWSCLCMLHVPALQMRSICRLWECLLCPLQLYTPLHAAAASGSVNVAQILLESGAEVDSRNSYGNTPLHIACLNGRSNVCSELTYYGADINALNYRGQVSNVWLYCIQGLFILLLQAFSCQDHVFSIVFCLFSTPSFLRFILNTWPFWFIILLE